jgi:hypothetical protein
MVFIIWLPYAESGLAGIVGVLAYGFRTFRLTAWRVLAKPRVLRLSSTGHDSVLPPAYPKVTDFLNAHNE